MLNTTKKRNRFVRGSLGAVIIILVILTILSGVLLSIRLINYIQVDEREVRLTSNLQTVFDLFSVEYKNASGEITVSGADGQKVVAPGTSVEYTIRLRNADKTAIDYEMIPKCTYSTQHAFPILVRMLDASHNYIIGSETTWVAIEDIAGMSAEKTLVKGESAEYYFQWKWEFESGDDTYDTFLGSLSNTENVGIEVAFTVQAEANTDIGTNGGIMQSGLGDIIAAGITLLLLIIAIVLTVMVFLKKRKSDSV